MSPSLTHMPALQHPVLPFMFGSFPTIYKQVKLRKFLSTPAVLQVLTNLLKPRRQQRLHIASEHDARPGAGVKQTETPVLGAGMCRP